MPDAVFVVNVLERFKRPPEHLFHYPPMLADLLAVTMDDAVPSVQVTAALRSIDPADRTELTSLPLALVVHLAEPE
jgi:hypothetical protein